MDLARSGCGTAEAIQKLVTLAHHLTSSFLSIVLLTTISATIIELQCHLRIAKDMAKFHPNFLIIAFSLIFQNVNEAGGIAQFAEIDQCLSQSLSRLISLIKIFSEGLKCYVCSNGTLGALEDFQIFPSPISQRCVDHPGEEFLRSASFQEVADILKTKGLLQVRSWHFFRIFHSRGTGSRN